MSTVADDKCKRFATLLSSGFVIIEKYYNDWDTNIEMVEK